MLVNGGGSKDCARAMAAGIAARTASTSAERISPQRGASGVRQCPVMRMSCTLAQGRKKHAVLPNARDIPIGLIIATVPSSRLRVNGWPGVFDLICGLPRKQNHER